MNTIYQCPNCGTFHLYDRWHQKTLETFSYQADYLTILVCPTCEQANGLKDILLFQFTEEKPIEENFSEQSKDEINYLWHYYLKTKQ